MKKVIFSMCLAALAIGCAKTEVQFEQTDAISFAPVAKVATKAAISGVDFNTTEPLKVFANAVTQVKNAEGNVTGLLTDNNGIIYEEYLKNASFTRTDVADPYTGSYYWPNVKALLFAGYVNAGSASASIDSPVETMTISGYTQPDSGDNDLMYFFNRGTNNFGFTKRSANIDVVMNHACAWLVFNIKGNGVTGKANTTWKIHELQVMNISKTGTATLTSSSVVWDETDKTKEYEIYKAVDETQAQTLSTSAFTPCPTNCIVIPQVPTELYIKYSYVSQEGLAPIVEETTVPLTVTGSTEWEAGKKYTYDVTVTATAIKIMPPSSDWTPGTTTTPTI